MNKKKWEKLEEDTKNMTPENKVKYAEFMTLLDKASSIDWGFVLMIIGLSFMAFCYFLKILVDLGVIPDF